MCIYVCTHAELDIWCELTFMLRGGNSDRMYKNITISDDNLVNPWRGLHLRLKSPDKRIKVQENCSYAIIWVKDNDGSQTTGKLFFTCVFFK